MNFASLVDWIKKIEELGHPWTLQKNPKGVSRCLLSSSSLFCKLAKIYSNHFTADKERLRNTILSFSREDGMLEDIPGDKNIVSETRQSFSGLINLGYEVPKFDCSSFFKEPLYFMKDSEWNNPWGAGAHLSHYLFFMTHSGQPDKVEKALKDLEKFERPEGWYHKQCPDGHILVNGIMKVMTAFDAAEIPLPEKNIRGILEFVFSYTCAHGGCGIYDLVYVVDKCMDYGIRENQCKEVMSRCYENISKHQQNDGGLAYDRNCCQTSFYGKGIAEPYPCGDVHGTTLFSMALVRIDKRLNLGLNLCPAVT
jgi:hypothetical protein